MLLPTRRSLLVAGSLCLLLALFACDKPSPPQHKTPETKPEATPAPSRIVSFVPSMTEITFDLGLGDKVVGVSTFDTFPPEVQKLEKMGGMLDPNLEKLLLLKPDLVLITPSVKGVAELTKTKEITTVSLKTDTLDDVFTAYRAIGEKAHLQDLASARIQNIQQELKQIRANATQPSPKVLLIVGRDKNSLGNLYAAGQGSFLDDLLQAAGGTNALAPTLGKWPQVNKESLLASPPDVILEFSATPSTPEADKETLESWKTLPQLTAVKNQRIHRITGSHVLLPGPRLTRTVKEIQKALQGKP